MKQVVELRVNVRSPVCFEVVCSSSHLIHDPLQRTRRSSLKPASMFRVLSLADLKWIPEYAARKDLIASSCCFIIDLAAFSAQRVPVTQTWQAYRTGRSAQNVYCMQYRKTPLPREL